MRLGHRLRTIGKDNQSIEVIKRYSDIPEINCDIEQLNQVFMNLLANAIDAFEEANEQGAIDEPIITITTESSDSEVIILIADNGSGIAERTVENILSHTIH